MMIIALRLTSLLSLLSHRSFNLRAGSQPLPVSYPKIATVTATVTLAIVAPTKFRAHLFLRVLWVAPQCEQSRFAHDTGLWVA